MKQQDLHQHIFQNFLHQRQQNESLKQFMTFFSPSDLEWLIIEIQQLQDPSAYCQNSQDQKTVTGFFEYLDFISYLLIHFNISPGLLEQKRNKGQYLEWIQKYLQDSRFHEELLSRFAFLEN